MWVAISRLSGTPSARITSNTISPQAAADSSNQFSAPYIRLPAWWSMLMMKWPSRPATPVRLRSLHSITMRASASASLRVRDLDPVDARELTVVVRRRVGIDEPHLLAERLERVGHRQLGADRVAVGTGVRRQQEPLAAENRLADRGHDSDAEVAAW